MNGKLRKSLALLLTLVLAVGCLTACSNGANEGNGGNGGTGNNTTSDAGAGEETTLKIGVTLPTLKAVHFVNMQYGFEDEAALQGVEVSVLNAGGYENVETQINQIQDFIAAGYDGIIVAAADADAVVAAEQEAIDNGIPVINVNNMSNCENIFAQIRSDDTEMGTMCADLLAEMLGGTGNVILVNANAGNALTARGYAFRDRIETEYPDINIIFEDFIPADAAQAASAIEDYLQTYPDVQGLFSWSDTCAIPCASAIDASGRDIKIVTIDCSNPDTRAMITDGKIDAAVAQQPVTLGRIGLQTMISIIKGEPYEEKIFAPVQAVTADDIATLDLSGIVIPE